MNKKVIIGCIVLFVLAILWALISIYPDWLWFENLQFAPIFWTMLLSRFGFGLIIWIFLLIIISVNLFIAKRLSPAAKPGETEPGYFAQIGISPNTFNIRAEPLSVRRLGFSANGTLSTPVVSHASSTTSLTFLDWHYQMC